MDEERNIERDEEARRRGGAAAYAQTGAFARPAEDVRAFEGRVWWGPIWAGFLTYMSLWLWFTVIGTAIWLSAASRPATAFGTGYGIWVGISSLVAIFIGAFLMSRLARIINKSTGAWNGVVLWALSFTLLLILTSMGVGGMLGMLTSQTGVGGGTAGAANNMRTITTAATSAWLFALFQFLALLCAAAGGAAGTRASEEERA